MPGQATVWDQFSDPVAAQSWDDFSDPVTQKPMRSRAELQAIVDEYNAGLDKPERQYSLRENIGGAVAEPVTTLATGLVATPLAGIAGVLQGLKNKVAGGGMPAEDRVAQVQQALTYQPRTEAGKVTTAGVQYPFEKLAQLGRFAGGKTADATGSPAAATTVDTAIQMAPALFLRGKVGNGRSVASPARTAVAAEEVAPRAAAQVPAKLGRVPEKPPAVEELKAQAQAAYKRASDAGISISPASLNGLKARIVTDLKKEGVDPTLHPSTTAAMKRIVSTKGELSLDGLETLRKIAKDAEKSIAPADQRLAGKIVDHIDDYVERLGIKDVTKGDPAQAGALKEARALYSRQKKAEEIQNLFDQAEISAPNFSGSGMENALRTEFRKLAKNDRKMRRFNPEERAAIKKVAMGGPVENILRQIGKLAPTGVVSAGMGAMGGFAVGGPAGAAAVPAIGTVSRYAATRMTMRNANRAEELMRRGPQGGK